VIEAQVREAGFEVFLAQRLAHVPPIPPVMFALNRLAFAR
jgi:hypothetical protein